MIRRSHFDWKISLGLLLMVVLVVMTLLGTPRALAQAPEMGEAAYNANCSACHQANGQGIPAVFPPLAGHLPEIFEQEGGREFLIDTVLFGMQGEIVVNGMTYNGVMPGWQQLSDDEIAGVINYALTAWGNEDLLPDNYQLVQPSEVAAQRGETKTPAEVHAERAEVVGE